MSGNIFINYRRDDDAGFTQALYGRLEQAFPAERLFMDIDNIEPGLDFVQVLSDEVARCDVVIAVVGKNWLSVTDETGARRLDNPEDFVRIEIESALAHKKRVIPVLVNDARMPRSTELPETMRAFARCNAVRLTHERFRRRGQPHQVA
jgi:TIR domain